MKIAILGILVNLTGKVHWKDFTYRQRMFALRAMGA